MSLRLLLAFGVAALVVPSVAQGRSFRPGDIPNGDDRGCLNCHGDNSGSIMTEFGSDARGALEAGIIQQAHVDWSKICAFDSDEDGWTNGQELGDPDCVWTIGDTPAKPASTNPGVDTSHPPSICGNEKLDAGEPCEGLEMSRTDCMDENAGSGTLTCTDTCDFDYSQCSAPPGDVSSDGDGETGQEGCAVDARGASSGGALLVAVAALATMRRRRITST